jgi:hypothetical protein
MFRLVVFVPRSSGIDRTGLVDVEERIVAALDHRYRVRDHDLGSGHLKIVIHTDDPQGAWNAAKAAVPAGILRLVDAFYSGVGDRTEHHLWPPSPEPQTRGNG